MSSVLTPGWPVQAPQSHRYSRRHPSDDPWHKTRSRQVSVSWPPKENKFKCRAPVRSARVSAGRQQGEQHDKGNVSSQRHTRLNFCMRRSENRRADVRHNDYSHFRLAGQQPRANEKLKPPTQEGPRQRSPLAAIFATWLWKIKRLALVLVRTRRAPLEIFVCSRIDLE